MFRVRLHGRCGQGVVTAAELHASAAFRQDRYAQAFLSFGSERVGAPVMSFCRIDDRYFADAPAAVRPKLEAARRTGTFDEVTGGLDASTALFEAGRCLALRELPPARVPFTPAGWRQSGTFSEYSTPRCDFGSRPVLPRKGDV